jgi:hypothetical protein
MECVVVGVDLPRPEAIAALIRRGYARPLELMGADRPTLARALQRFVDRELLDIEPVA